MADSVEAAGFWLPSEFFDDENAADPDSEFPFPTDFPYNCEPHPNQNLEKRWMMSTSPQSTLAHLGSWSVRSAGGSSNGSPNGPPSPPTSPIGSKNDAVVDLIYRAAGEVARLKLNGGDGPGAIQHRGFPGQQRVLEHFNPVVKSTNSSAFQNIYLQQQMAKQQKQSSEMWYNEPPMLYQIRNGRAVGGMGQDAWPIQQAPTRIVGSGPRSVMLGGSGGGAPVKRERAGTGVFLPRRYGNNTDCNAYSSDSRKKPGYSGAAFIPERNVHGINKNFESMTGFVQSQPQSQPKFNRGYITEYDLLIARRNAVMLQQRRQSLLLEGRSSYLPQEWTY